ncbi:hypothetical protein PUR34_30570 [Streptomyces sp. JV185]|uniref:WD40 repeat domain-containing protein n=1 Tax=Streptomyces sp. JV185 TaxID=858638 RepID=UPI002E7881AB|nr:hypothetical protein [Streptomyces sp. JV185]MEE1772393.1 hypothetical protein [Streptomyces sp. JV185]
MDWATGGMVTPQLIHTLTGHTRGVEAVATVVVDGRPIAVTGSDDRTVRVWDLTTREQVGPELVFPAPVTEVATLPDGRLVDGFGLEVAALAPLT